MNKVLWHKVLEKEVVKRIHVQGSTYVPSKFWRQAKFQDKSSCWSSWNEENMVKLRFRTHGPPYQIFIKLGSFLRYTGWRLRPDTRVLLLHRTLSQEQRSSLNPQEAGTSEFASTNKDLMRIRAILSSIAQPPAMWNMNCKTHRTQSMVPSGK